MATLCELCDGRDCSCCEIIVWRGRNQLATPQEFTDQLATPQDFGEPRQLTATPPFVVRVAPMTEARAIADLEQLTSRLLGLWHHEDIVEAAAVAGRRAARLDAQTAG